MTAEKKETTRTSKKKKAVFSVNVKYGENLYRKGETLEVSETEFKTLEEAGIIQIGKGD